MVKKSEERKETIEGKRNITNIWGSNPNEFLKMWGDSQLKLYKPWIEFIGENSLKMTETSMNAAPKAYKEFYDNWMKTYQGTFGKIYPAPAAAPREALESFIKCADESNKLYMSWIDEFGENSRKTSEVLNNGMDPAKYRECFDSWLKTYEKVSEELIDHPAIKYQKKIFESYTGIPDFYTDSFVKMAKQWKELYAKLFLPSADSMQNISESLIKISKGEANPETYKEFYELWMNINKETFGKMFDTQSMKPSKELFDNLQESVNISLNMYKAWIDALEKMSEKLNDQSKLTSDPETFKEFYNLWMKMFEKTSEDFFEGAPFVSPMKEMMEPVKSACKIYANTSIKMSKLWLDSFTRAASSYKV